MSPQVTDIQVQEKRKDRFSIFLDGEFAFGVDQDVLLQSGIAKGDVLTPAQVQAMIGLEERKNARDKALRLLAVRARSEKELTDRLRQAKYSVRIIEEVIAELKRLKLLNDSDFAVMFARNRVITKPTGEYMLKQELKAKGLSEEDIQNGLDAAFQEKPEQRQALELAIKLKARHRQDEEIKARKKVNDHLLRRGFSWDIVNDIMDKWDNLEEQTLE
ncbi:MAG TPA: RecX family transcriptional regulator [bacterium]|nr:RecX family transcriptional regulator [bacterium]HPN42923.1 RecX family transcriptional regulator [bacterium]